MQINIEAPEKKKLHNLKKNDPWLSALLTATSYDQIDTFVDTQINNLDDARRLFKVILKVLVYVTRRI